MKELLNPGGSLEMRNVPSGKFCRDLRFPLTYRSSAVGTAEELLNEGRGNVTMLGRVAKLVASWIPPNRTERAQLLYELINHRLPQIKFELYPDDPEYVAAKRGKTVEEILG